MRVPAGQESSKNQPELGVDKPAHPCTWQGPAGASHPPPFCASKGAPPSGQGQADHSLEGGWDRQQELPDLLSPWLSPCCRDLVSFHSASHPPRDGSPLGGASGRPGGVPVEISAQALAGACPLTPQAIAGWGGPGPGQEAFLDPLPPQAGRGPGGPRRGGPATALTGTPAPWGLWGEPAHRLARARRRGGSTPAERGFLRPGPLAVEAAGRRAAAGTGGAGRRAPVGGPTSASPGSRAGRPPGEAVGRARCPGPAAASVNLDPSSEWPRTPLGGFICMSLACHLRSPPSHFAASRFSRSGF